MTNRVANREDPGEPTCDPRLAALLAVHLVSQVLDEAYVIVDAAKESGQPWNYISMLKNVKTDGLGETGVDNTSFGASKGDNDVVNEDKMGLPANVVATSTPQKVLDDITKVKPEACFIGQGDAELEMNQNELSKSTSMFISHLFDMSDVEQVVICDDQNNLSCNPEANDILTQAMTKIMESYVNTALGLTYLTDNQASGVNGFHVTETSSNADQSEHSAYSFMSDAFKTDFGKDATFNINNDGIYHKIDETFCVNVPEINEHINQDSNIKLNTDRNGSGDVAFYENYLTLNRDYEQCSDDEGEPVLQDPKGMMLQEVELITSNTSDDNSSSIVEPPQKSKELAATSAISAGASSRKSSLASRCRTQGARLLACLRGWWRRKTPGKRKEARYPVAIRGLCPLSPDARRRAASLLDHRELRSPSPSRSVVWKFNTVNEALVNSTRWKKYGFDTKYDDINEC